MTEINEKIGDIKVIKSQCYVCDEGNNTLDRYDFETNKFIHICNKCGNIVKLDKTYPYVTA